MTRDEIMVVEAAIDAMSEASRRYRVSAGLPGDSIEVPGWVAQLDASQVALTRLVEAAQRSLTS